MEETIREYVSLLDISTSVLSQKHTKQVQKETGCSVEDAMLAVAIKNTLKEINKLCAEKKAELIELFRSVDMVSFFMKQGNDMGLIYGATTRGITDLILEGCDA